MWRVYHCPLRIKEELTFEIDFKLYESGML